MPALDAANDATQVEDQRDDDENDGENDGEPEEEARGIESEELDGYAEDREQGE